MFYCVNCQKENAWPESFMRSRGQCEVCDEVDDCFDLHHSFLSKKRKFYTHQFEPPQFYQMENGVLVRNLNYSEELKKYRENN